MRVRLKENGLVRILVDIPNRKICKGEEGKVQFYSRALRGFWYVAFHTASVYVHRSHLERIEAE